MKLYHDYKKLFNTIALITLFLSSFLFVHAQTADDLNAKISQRNQDIANLEQQIAGYQAQLDSLGQQKSSLNESLQTLDVTRKQLVANISLTQNKIDQTNLKIESLSSQITVKTDSINNDTTAISLEIKQVNEFELNTTVETILSENNFSQVWNDLENIATVADKIRSDIVNLKQVKGELEDTKTQTVAARKELTTLKSQLADQKKIVDQNTADKKKLLAQTKNSEANYQKILQASLAQKTAFQQEIRDYESQLKYVLDPSKLPSGGVLSWPLDNIFVTQMFGKTEAGKRLYANGTHNGVDFRAAIGTPVYAMADGVVAGTGDTDLQCAGVSFGRFELIKYNNGLASTYGHLSLIKVHAGETVTRGELVGYSGKTGYATGPHLHVSLYPRDAVNLQTLPSKSCPGKVLTQPIAAINAYLDPMIFLPPYKG